MQNKGVRQHPSLSGREQKNLDGKRSVQKIYIKF